MALNPDIKPTGDESLDNRMKEVVTLLKKSGFDSKASRNFGDCYELEDNAVLIWALSMIPESDPSRNWIFPTGAPDNLLVRALSLRVGHRAVRLQLVARELLRASPKDHSQQPEWRKELLLAIILGDTWANTKALESVRPVLSAIGVPVQGWLLEYKERLYNRWGHETYEPVFYREYLVRVAQAMWELSTRVFAHNTFSYETLAAQMREPNVERVRHAVRRIGIVCDPPDKKAAPGGSPAKKEAPFWYGQERWRWVVQSRVADREHCSYVAFHEVEEKLGLLQSPEGEQQ